ncbi:MAG: tetratricopeptide repeat protein [Acidobacteriota bacterium]
MSTTTLESPPHTFSSDRFAPRGTAVFELTERPARFCDLSAVSRELDLPAEAVLVDCRRSVAGAWAGALSLLEDLVPRLEADMPELLERHRHELTAVSPELRRRLPNPTLPLTESGPVKERVRSYPVDRAFRLSHGLVDLLLAWQGRPGARPMQLVCWGFDDAGALTERFFRELERRRPQGGDGAALRLAFVVSPGRGEETAASFGPAPLRSLSVEAAARGPERATLLAEADRLEARLDRREGELEREGARLISVLEELGDEPRAAPWRVFVLAVLNHFGWYEDALDFATPVVGQLDSMAVHETRFSRWHIVSGLFNALVALGRAEEAHVLVRDEGMAKVDDPTELVSIYYTMAMLHVRFLPEKNLALGEEYLMKSLETVERAPLDNAERHYLKVFNLNGLAFIRHLEGSPPAAIELCEDGYNHLEEHLASDEYRLHRSVLLYNLAQVYASTNHLQKSLEHYTAAMGIDPYYSEYHNERAGVLLRLGRVEEALADVERAIELSPPYPEAWINLGQILNLLGRFDDAASAYSRALDLDPERLLPWLGRAQAREARGLVEPAIGDYRRALVLDPRQPTVWANLAALEYEAGRLDRALAARERAVEGQPDVADFYQNRAVVLADLGRPEAAANDLRHYLTLAPGAEDASSVTAKVRELEAISA